MDASLVGESAAILTSCLWTFSSLFFTSAGRRFGSFSVNAYRTIIAIGFLGFAHVLLLGTLLPLATPGQWFWMGLSGIIGLGIGDFGLFAAYVLIGPRRTVLIQSSAPIFASLGAFLMLGETFSAIAALGVAVTLTGIFVVLLEKQTRNQGFSQVSLGEKKRKSLGVLFGLVSAMGQGFGAVLSKKGMILDNAILMNPLSAAFIRTMVTGLFVWGIAAVTGRLPELHRAIMDRKGIRYAAAGALVGPFAGMTLSMVAIASTETGIAQTLMSLSPILIIPVIWVIYKEKTNWRGMLGAIVAIIGITILFLA